MSVMQRTLREEAALLDLPVEVLTTISLHLDLRDLVRIAKTCRLFHHGSSGSLCTVKLPTKSPVATALLAFPGNELIPSTRPIGCSDSLIAYLTRSVRQRSCREAPPLAAGWRHSIFVDATGQLLTCGNFFPDLTPVAAMAAIRVRSVASKGIDGLAVGWNGQVYSWGTNNFGQLGHGDTRIRLKPTLVEGLEDVRSIAAACGHSWAVTQSGSVFRWGCDLLRATEPALRPIIVNGFGRMHVRCVSAEEDRVLAIGNYGELFSW
jgi:hypothetical protein